MKVCPGVASTLHPQHRADLDDVAIFHRNPVEGHRVGRVDVVGRPGGPGQRQPAGHVVVVQMGLEHVGDPHSAGRGQVQHTVDVPLRIHHHGDVPVMREVAPVAQRGRIDRHDLDARSCRGTHETHPFNIPRGVSDSFNVRPSASGATAGAVIRYPRGYRREDLAVIGRRPDRGAWHGCGPRDDGERGQAAAPGPGPDRRGHPDDRGGPRLRRRGHPARRRGPRPGPGRFQIIATGLQQCAVSGDGTAEADRAQLEKLFLSLA